MYDFELKKNVKFCNRDVKVLNTDLIFLYLELYFMIYKQNYVSYIIRNYYLKNLNYHNNFFISFQIILIEFDNS